MTDRSMGVLQEADEDRKRRMENPDDDHVISVAKVGDWVRFYINGTLVIGVVQYVTYDSIRLRYTLSTDVGCVDSQYVMEIRR